MNYKGNLFKSIILVWLSIVRCHYINSQLIPLDVVS